MHFNGQIKLITFDGDDTLWDFTVMMERGLAAVLEMMRARLGDLGAHIDADFLRERYHASYDESVNLQTVNYLEHRRKVYGQIMAETGYAEWSSLADELIENYLIARQERYEFYTDAHPTLEALRERYKLGYITNGTTHPEEIGLADYFDVVILPETLGMRKPKPEIFHHAAAEVGCKVDELLHIGDSLESDIAGVQAAGGWGVWFNPQKLPNPTPIEPHAEINTLADVLSLLG